MAKTPAGLISTEKRCSRFFTPSESFTASAAVELGATSLGAVGREDRLPSECSRIEEGREPGESEESGVEGGEIQEVRVAGTVENFSSKAEGPVPGGTGEDAVEGTEGAEGVEGAERTDGVESKIFDLFEGTEPSEEFL